MGSQDGYFLLSALGLVGSITLTPGFAAGVMLETQYSST